MVKSMLFYFLFEKVKLSKHFNLGSTVCDKQKKVECLFVVKFKLYFEEHQ